MTRTVNYLSCEALGHVPLLLVPAGKLTDDFRPPFCANSHILWLTFTSDFSFLFFFFSKWAVSLHLLLLATSASFWTFTTQATWRSSIWQAHSSPGHPTYATPPGRPRSVFIFALFGQALVAKHVLSLKGIAFSSPRTSFAPILFPKPSLPLMTSLLIVSHFFRGNARQPPTL